MWKDWAELSSTAISSSTQRKKMKHLAAITSISSQQYDRARSRKSVVFNDALINHDKYLRSFNDALEAAAPGLARQVREHEEAYDVAMSRANTAEAKKDATNREGQRWRRARVKLKKAETAVYITHATKAELSTNQIKALELLCKMNETKYAKPPKQQQLETLLGGALSEETKGALSAYNNAKKQEAQSLAKTEFVYHLMTDMADEFGKNATNESGKALTAKLADNYNRKYWSTQKGKNADRCNAAVPHREWFFPSIIRQIATAFSQLVIVDSVDENDERIKKISKLLDEIESSEGDERKKKIHDFWRNKS